MRRIIFLLSCCAIADEHALTLKQTVERALDQNPDVLLARLEERRTSVRVQEVRDPYYPKIYAGSGLAYTSGIPMSIEGSAPSIIQAQAFATIFNRPLKYQVDKSRQEARSAGIATAGRQELAVRRAVELFLNSERLQRNAQASRRRVESAQRLEDFLRARVEEGRELPIELRKASLEIARARQATVAFESGRELTESTLAYVLGYPAGDRVRALPGDRLPPQLPAHPAAIKLAYDSNPELRKLESDLAAKEMELRSHRAAWLPQVNIMAQYSLLGRYNNYDKFFSTFQRHNGQIGVSIQVPLRSGPADDARATQAELELRRIRLELNRVRSEISTEISAGFQEIQRRESDREVARLELDVAREEVGLLLARMEEGRASPLDVERARADEAARWIVYYDSTHALEQARMSLLYRTGQLTAAVR
jgi:outer membrane protein TolC